MSKYTYYPHFTKDDIRREVAALSDWDFERGCSILFPLTKLQNLGSRVLLAAQSAFVLAMSEGLRH